MTQQDTRSHCTCRGEPASASELSKAAERERRQHLKVSEHDKEAGVSVDSIYLYR